MTDVNQRLFSRKQACTYMGVGVDTGTRVLKEIGAAVRVNKCDRYDRNIIDEYINTHSERYKTENP